MDVATCAMVPEKVAVAIEVSVATATEQAREPAVRVATPQLRRRLRLIACLTDFLRKAASKRIISENSGGRRDIIGQRSSPHNSG